MPGYVVVIKEVKHPGLQTLNKPSSFVTKALVRSAIMHFPALAFLLAVVSPGTCQLHKLAKAAGLKYFGTAVDNPALNNQAYMRIARDGEEFGSITPANGQKWSNTQGSQGSFSYGSGDAVANVARQSGQQLRCHTLVWHNQLPNWGQLSLELLQRATDTRNSQ
jgi:GH35 family endo-1,4-beta-xylanase